MKNLRAFGLMIGISFFGTAANADVMRFFSSSDCSGRPLLIYVNSVTPSGQLACKKLWGNTQPHIEKTVEIGGICLSSGNSDNWCN